METNIKDLKDLFLDNKVKYVKVALSDIDGILRGKYMHVDKFLSSVESKMMIPQHQKRDSAESK